MYIQPPHQAWDKEKLALMVKHLEAGKSLPPILVCDNQAYSGSHRIEAWEIMEMEVDYIEISTDDRKKVFESMNLDIETDEINDFESFLEEAIWLGLCDGAK